MFPAPAGYWRTLDNQVLRISDLDDNHLQRCIDLVAQNLRLGFYKSPKVRVSTQAAEEKLQELFQEQMDRCKEG